MTLEEIITARRSVRSYTDEPIDEEAILKLLDMARWAPYASESWRFVVVRSQQGRSALASAARQEFVATAPVVVVVGADTDAFATHHSVWHRWDAYKFRGLFYIQETAAAIENLMLAAVEMGLGTCWIGSFNEGEVSKIVEFPASIRPVAMITIGHPAGGQRRADHAPLEKIVYWEKYASADE